MTVLKPKLSTPGKIDIARAALANDLPALSKLVAAIPGDSSATNTTKDYATRFLTWFENQSGPTPFSVFAAAGNMKLPFYAFSSLPGFDCPGAGACLYGENEFTPENFRKGWCYSFTGWRYPAAMHIKEARATSLGLCLGAAEPECFERRLLSVGDNLSEIRAAEVLLAYRGKCGLGSTHFSLATGEVA